MNTISSLFKTISLKIHNPSRKKQLIMDEAMRRYAAALQTMLDHAWEKREMIKSFCDSDVSIKKHTGRLADKELLKSLNRYNVQPFKDSLKVEFISLIESYVKRLKKSGQAPFPRVTVTHHDLCKSLNDPMCSVKSIERLYNKYESHGTIYFCRYSDCRDYSLLYDPIKKRFYAKLYLLSQSDELKHMPGYNAGSPLIIVGKNKVLPSSDKPERFILVVLSFGKVQEKLLHEALKHPEMLKTARLTKRGMEYYLDVNLAVEPEPAVKTKSFAGFHFSAQGAMRYHVCDLKGELIDQGEIAFDHGAPLPDQKDKLHIVANKIVSLCVRNHSQAVLDSYPHYNGLADILSYKLPLKGLKKPVRVSPFGMWQTCPRCGYNCRKNSSMQTVFICAACGFGIESALLPSYNLSKRLINYHSSKIRFCLQTEGRSRIIKNSMMNIEYGIQPGKGIEDFFEYIKIRTDLVRAYLENRETDWTKDDKKLYSLWNKLMNADDIKNVIEIDQ